MIRYRHDPERPDAPIIEAAPRDLDRYRGDVRAYYSRRWSSIGPDTDDAIQDTMIIVSQAFAEGRIRGTNKTPPEKHVRAYVLDIAWCVASTYAQKYKRRARLFVLGNVEEVEEVADASATPERIALARETLAKLLQEAHDAGKAGETLLLYLEIGDVEEVARRRGISPHAVHASISYARKHLRRPRKRKR